MFDEIYLKEIEAGLKSLKDDLRGQPLDESTRLAIHEVAQQAINGLVERGEILPNEWEPCIVEHGEGRFTSPVVDTSGGPQCPGPEMNSETRSV